MGWVLNFFGDNVFDPLFSSVERKTLNYTT